jgi:hypothetical protein
MVYDYVIGYVCMHICIYVYPGYSRQRTVIFLISITIIFELWKSNILQLDFNLSYVDSL